jgi:hypothetical protein
LIQILCINRRGAGSLAEIAAVGVALTTGRLNPEMKKAVSDAADTARKAGKTTVLRQGRFTAW